MTADSTEVVEVRYCEGWDPQARAVVAPMSEREARGRDESGAPYAALLARHGQPRALFQVDWRNGYLGLVLFDARVRRSREYTYRQLEPGRLHLQRYREWLHSSDTEPEFPEDGHFTLTVRPDGRANRVLHHGGTLHIGTDVPAEHRTVAKAEFGAWTAYADAQLLGLDGPFTLVPTGVDGEASEAAEPGWSAPVPLRPQHLEALFTPGSRLGNHGEQVAVVTAPRSAGLLRLPTGSVIAADPLTVHDRDLPFTVTVPPDAYPVLIATMHWEGRTRGETPAAMLRIRDTPTATWELALRPGQDARSLGTDEFYGFGVDTGMGCFLDASGRDVLPKLFEQRQWETDLWGAGQRPYAEVSAPDAGANLIAYPSGVGDGSYPVWIGRDADGEVTCFLADMLLLHRAEALPPTAPDTSVCLPAFPALPDDRRERPFTGPGATADFLAAQLAHAVDFLAERRQGWG
ncbi:DUF4241 domain-containing protein [Kitasatospora sp. CB02891]|uniref:DUF4241 domain-containing protein n=1 Tax=Kitasatospora sp. CB02891 TaxID=2020329 RepID=UPI000C273990|nr:DUF4241 domain-containing protein [Kitasatospora sp. CB02891]PJN27957.1 hypothetical protein CG736_07095 [Kitasatospora sp. CB02891]